MAIKHEKAERTFPHTALVLGLCAFLIGCASPVNQADIKAFADAAATVSTTLEKSRTVQRSFAGTLSTELQARQYINGNRYEFPPKPLPTAALAADAWAPRVTLLKAIAAYAKSLGDLEDPAAPTKTEAAVTNLQGAVQAFKPTGEIVAFVGPVSGLLQIAVHIGVVQQNAVLARTTVVRAHPWIEQSVALLKDDFARLSFQADTRYRSWILFKQAQLDDFRQQDRVKKTDLYRTYRDFVQQKDDVYAGLVLFLVDPETRKPGYVAVLDALVKAHAALMEEKADRQALLDFLTVVERLAAVIKVAQAQ